MDKNAAKKTETAGGNAQGFKPQRGRKQFRGKRKEEKKSPEAIKDSWIPRTEIGKLVKADKIDSIKTIWEMGKKIRESEIIDLLVPDLEERVVKIGRGNRPFKWVQRMTDSGRRNKYYVVVAVGDKKGHIGISIGRAKEYGGAIANGIRLAKLNIIKINRGCGSWDCGCDGEHSIAMKTVGRAGSVEVQLKPAPKGTGLVANSTSKDILELAGISDIWSFSKGQTSTRSNLAHATFKALNNLNKVKRSG